MTLLTKKELAQKLNVSVRTVERMRKLGIIKPVRGSRPIIFNSNDIAIQARIKDTFFSKK